MCDQAHLFAAATTLKASSKDYIDKTILALPRLSHFGLTVEDRPPTGK